METWMSSALVGGGVAGRRGRGAGGAARAEGPVWSTAGSDWYSRAWPQDPVFVAAGCLLGGRGRRGRLPI